MRADRSRPKFGKAAGVGKMSETAQKEITSANFYKFQ
jgi:hypothetical protein